MFHLPLISMYKSIAAAAAVIALAPAGAIAGPYLNAETNAGWTGSQSNGAQQICTSAMKVLPALPPIMFKEDHKSRRRNGGATDIVFSAKAGAGIDLTEKINAYGELSLATGVDGAANGYGGKLGVKYSF